MDSWGRSREVEKPKNRTERHAELRVEAARAKRDLGVLYDGIRLLTGEECVARVILVRTTRLIDRLLAELK